MVVIDKLKVNLILNTSETFNVNNSVYRIIDYDETDINKIRCVIIDKYNKTSVGSILISDVPKKFVPYIYEFDQTYIKDNDPINVDIVNVGEETINAITVNITKLAISHLFRDLQGEYKVNILTPKVVYDMNINIRKFILP